MRLEVKGELYTKGQHLYLWASSTEVYLSMSPANTSGGRRSRIGTQTSPELLLMTVQALVGVLPWPVFADYVEDCGGFTELYEGDVGRICSLLREETP